MLRVVTKCPTDRGVSTLRWHGGWFVRYKPSSKGVQPVRALSVALYTEQTCSGFSMLPSLPGFYDCCPRGNGGNASSARLRNLLWPRRPAASADQDSIPPRIAGLGRN